MKNELMELLGAINTAKEGKAPGRRDIPAVIWKHTWRYGTRHLDILRREKFCSKARFKQGHTTADFPCAQETLYSTVPVPYAGVAPGAYKELLILSSSL